MKNKVNYRLIFSSIYVVLIACLLVACAQEKNLATDMKIKEENKKKVAHKHLGTTKLKKTKQRSTNNTSTPHSRKNKKNIEKKKYFHNERETNGNSC